MEVVFPLFDGFTALDAIGPYEVLSRLPGARVTFASLGGGEAAADTGALRIPAGADLRDVDRCDVVVVPGGPGTRRMMRDAELLEWVRRIHQTTAWTASVCTGSLVLGGAGLLRGVPAATHWSALDLLESTGARYSAQRVVVDGKIVTAAGVSAGIDMALVLAARLAGDVVAEAIQLGIEYDPEPPFDSGSLAKARPAAVALARAAQPPEDLPSG